MKRALLLLAFVACKQHSLVPDETWAVADYTKAGVPAVDHVWTAAEQRQASEVIAARAKDHAELLPRFGGEKSGPVFARLIEPGPADSAGEISTRFQAHLERFNAQNELLKVYAPYSVLLSRETFEVLGVLFRESAELEALAEPFIASFGPDDPQHANRVGGLATMRKGWSQMITGALMTLTDTRISEANRRILAGYIIHALPVFFPKLPPDEQDSIRDRFTKDLSEISGPLHDDLAAAQKLVR